MLEGGEMHGGEAETHGGAPRRVSEGPGRMDGAVEDGTRWGELGWVVGCPRMSVWDGGMPWVGSEHRESG